MHPEHTDYTTAPYTRYRRWTAEMFRSVRHKRMMHALFEVDVSDARAWMRERKATTGEDLSFTAFLIACLAKAVDEHKAVQAYRQGRSRLILFDDVDVFTPIEHDGEGQKQVVPTIVRAANRKSVREIHHEIRAAQSQDMRAILQRRPFPPSVLFRPYFWLFSWRGRRDPRVWKKAVGTVGLTAVGMFGYGAGWGIPIPTPSLMVTVGGIGKKPGGVDGRIELREYLSLTVSVDHELVDGAPAARFTRRLKELIERGYGLDAPSVATIVSAQAAARERAPTATVADDAPPC